MATKQQTPEANLGVFEAVRETKNFVRFEHEVEDGKPLTMYVPNETVEALGDPSAIEVILKAVR